VAREPVSVRLLARLRAEGIVPEDADAEIGRTFASRSQKTAGAWTWSVQWRDGTFRSAGSQWPMACCLAAVTLEAGAGEWGTDVDPPPADRAAWLHRP
jgi:hypothetical protein